MGVGKCASVVYPDWVQLDGNARSCGQLLTCARSIPSFAMLLMRCMPDRVESAFERLFKYMQLLIEFG